MKNPSIKTRIVNNIKINIKVLIPLIIDAPTIFYPSAFTAIPFCICTLLLVSMSILSSMIYGISVCVLLFSFIFIAQIVVFLSMPVGFLSPLALGLVRLNLGRKTVIFMILSVRSWEVFFLLLTLYILLLSLP